MADVVMSVALYGWDDDDDVANPVVAPLKRERDTCSLTAAPSVAELPRTVTRGLGSVAPAVHGPPAPPVTPVPKGEPNSASVSPDAVAFDEHDRVHRSSGKCDKCT